MFSLYNNINQRNAGNPHIWEAETTDPLAYFT